MGLVQASYVKLLLFAFEWVQSIPEAHKFLFYSLGDWFFLAKIIHEANFHNRIFSFTVVRKYKANLLSIKLESYIFIKGLYYYSFHLTGPTMV